jgi:valyl-tRNA synthetase
LFTEDGKLSDLAGSFAGLTIQVAREAILKALGESGALKKQEAITQTVNVHERCGTPTEFILSKQWFIKIADLKDTWLKYGKELSWYPKDREQDYVMWVNSLKWDWCISRQRYYGVPLPIWYCVKCNEPVFAKEQDLPVNPLEDKPPQEACASCGGKLVPEKDVMDTWATSSCTPFLIHELVEEGARNSLFPVTLRPNAFEIIRTWDFYSVVKAHYHFGSLPFKDVMISGHGVDEGGKKLEKRLGNYIPSDELLEKYDADPIRYWATGAMLGQNLKFNTKEIEKGKKTVIKLWNVAKLLEMSLEGFEPNTEPAELEHADVWIILEFNAALKNATLAFEQYAYAKARDTIDDFFWAKFTDYYIEFVKYRLKGENISSKKAAQQTLYKIFGSILKMYAPILPFAMEELYHQLYAIQEGKKTIHLSSWPQAIGFNDIDIEGFDTAINAIDEIRKFKSLQGMSLGTEMEEYTLKVNVDIQKYGEFIRQAIRVKNLKRKE